MKIDYNKYIWEGWTVQSFINELDFFVDIAISGRSHLKTIKSKSELKEFCKDNQPYYKKYIPEVVEHFAKQYDLK